jgi:hypothetical protein
MILLQFFTFGCSVLLILMFIHWKEWFNNGKFTESEMNYLYWTFLVILILVIIRSLYLIFWYSNNFKFNLSILKQIGKEKYLENEYMLSYEPFSKWVEFYITLFLSILAIGTSFIVAQFSVDTALWINNNKMDYSISNKLSESIGWFLWLFIVWVFIFFILNKFINIQKHCFLKEKFLDFYKKDKTIAKKQKK